LSLEITTSAAIHLLSNSLGVTIHNYDVILSSVSGNFCRRLQTEQKVARKTTSKSVEKNRQND